MNKTTKDISLVAVLSALIISISIMLPPLLFFVFAIIVMSIHKTQAYLIAFVVGVISYLITGQPMSTINIILLPMFVYLIDVTKPFYYRSKKHQELECSSTKRISNVALGLTTGVIVLLLNTINEFAAFTIWQYTFEQFISSMPLAIGGAIVTGLLLGFVGVYLQQRFTKLLMYAKV